MQKFYFDKIIKKLANLKLAITLLFTIGIVVALGTFIEQNQSLSFYQAAYSESESLFGFLNWKVIVFFQLDHIYTSLWFTLLLFFFCLSLLSCTFTVQLPSLKKFRRWKFYRKLSSVNDGGGALSKNATNTFAFQLHNSNFHIFRQGKKNYSYTGLLGRIGPIIVHASIIILLIGSSIGSFGGYTAQEIVPRGEIFHIQNIIQFGSVSQVPQTLSWRVNDFWITYTNELKTNQFYSDLSLIDSTGNELKRKTIFVNEPFIYKGITLYQTDWDIVGMKFLDKDNYTTQLPFKKISKNGRKFWLGSITIEGSKAIKLTVLVNDLSGKLLVYNDQGILIKECVLGEQVRLINGENITFVDFLTSTGLQIKSDPGIGTVYLSFLLLIVSIYASFISYSQIWGAEEGKLVFLMGNSNRAVLFFQTKFRKLINKASTIV